jgi:hypothetical protein
MPVPHIRESFPTLIYTGFIGRSDKIINLYVRNVVLARFIVFFIVVEERNFGNN